MPKIATTRYRVFDGVHERVYWTATRIGAIVAYLGQMPTTVLRHKRYSIGSFISVLHAGEVRRFIVIKCIYQEGGESARPAI